MKTHLLYRCCPDEGEDIFHDRYTACGLDADAHPEGNTQLYVFRKSGREVQVVETNPTCKKCAGAPTANRPDNLKVATVLDEMHTNLTRECGGEQIASKPDVIFIPAFLNCTEADALLERIRSEGDFKQNYIQLFGRKAIPRLEAWYGSWDYPYSNGVVLKAAPMPDYLQAVIDKIAEAGFGDLNAVLINRYRSGKDYISVHSDDDYGDSMPTIPSLTLGAARPFRLAKWLAKGKKLDKTTTVEYMPGHGDLLVMRGATNQEWGHWVPKTAKAIGERINLTFRSGGAR